MQISKAPTIEDMLFELEADLRARKPSEDDYRYGAYLAARLEMEITGNPDLAYVRNVLASALNRPLATRH